MTSATESPRLASGRPSAGIPLWFWLPIFIGPTLVWLFVLPFQRETGPPFLDWNNYRTGLDLWQSVGTPFVVLPPNWDPFILHPYLYPPTSWPVMFLAAALPPGAAAIGVVPLVLRRPQLILVPVAALLLALGLGPALYLGNVNLIVAGLIVLSFLPGRWGGLAFGALVAIKLYPIVLLPLLWGDRTRVRWFVATLGALAVTGTLFFGIQGWLDFATTLLREGPNPDISWNPFTSMGIARILPAGVIVLVGLGLRSPTVVLIGATWTSGVVTNHYLVTFAAVLAVEPPLRETAARIQRGVQRAAQRVGAHGPPVPGTVHAASRRP